MSTCSAYGCTNRSERKPPGVTFHLFPKERIRKKAWTIALKRKDFKPTKYTRVCSEHFADECFLRTKKVVKLKPNAIPTIFKKFPEHLKNVSTMSPLTDFISDDVIKIEGDMDDDNPDESIDFHLGESVDDFLQANADENIDSLSESVSSEDESSSEAEPPDTDVVYVSEEGNEEGNAPASAPRIIKVIPHGGSGELLAPSKANLDKRVVASLASYLKYQDCAQGAPDAQGGPTVSVIFVQPPPNEAYPLIPCGQDMQWGRKPTNLEYRIINQTRKIRAMNQMNERYQVKIAQLERTIENFKNPTTSDEDEPEEDDITVDEIYHEMLKRQQLEDDVES